MAAAQAETARTRDAKRARGAEQRRAVAEMATLVRFHTASVAPVRPENSNLFRSLTFSSDDRTLTQPMFAPIAMLSGKMFQTC
jgi:hypothetical protein